jgi:putative spermidine/putrescine transport system substrate-binding protein
MRASGGHASAFVATHREEDMAKLLGQGAKTKKLKQVSRRTFLQGAGALGLGLAAGPALVTEGKAQASTVIRYADDGGYNFDMRMQYYLKPFMDKTGIQIEHFVGERGLAKLKAMQQVNNLEFDMSNDLGTVAAAADNAGYLAPLDKSRLDLSQHMFPQWVFPGTIAWQYYTGAIGYNEESLKGKPLPSTWAEYWDFDKFPGRRGMLSRPQDTLEQALLADGVPADKLYPLDLDRAYKSMDKIKNRVAVWIDDTGQTIQLLQTKEIDYTYTTSARVFAARSSGEPLNLIDELPISPPQNVQIIKGTPIFDACMQLVTWFCQNQEAGTAYFSKQIGYGPTNQPTYEALPADTIKQLPSKDNTKAVWTDIKWWAENLVPVTERHKLWLLS